MAAGLAAAASAEAVANDKSIFSVIREGDLLVHHPYDSFATTVEDFIGQAADDPQVLVDQDDAVPRRR